MKLLRLLIVACLLCFSCNDRTKGNQPVIHDTVTIQDNNKVVTYPLPLNEIFKVHGRLDLWKDMYSIRYDMVYQNKVETHTVSLKDRKTKIIANQWVIGFDGTDVWKLEHEENAYRGDAVFSYNLMFYFLAMPFVLADQGIHYEELKATELDGEVFEGIKISYDDGVGNSPKDEYILYYHPDTHQMTWLAYTVTYDQEEPNQDWRYVKYSEWQKVNGFLLPKTLTWYTVENGKPVQARNYRNFENITLTETKLDDTFFDMPEGAVKVVKE